MWTHTCNACTVFTTRVILIIFQKPMIWEYSCLESSLYSLPYHKSHTLSLVDDSWRHHQRLLSHIIMAISRKVAGKSASDNPKRYWGWFCVHCFSKKFERMAREAIDVRLPVLLKGNYLQKLQCIDHIPNYLSGLSRAHFLGWIRQVQTAYNRSQVTSDASAG